VALFERLARLRNSRLFAPQSHPGACTRVNPPVTGDIKRWCADHVKAGYQLLAEPETIHRRLPRTLEPEVHSSFLPYLEMSTLEKALVQVSDASLVGPNGLVMLPDGSFVGQLIANGPEGWQAILAKQPAYTSPLPPVRRQRGSYCSLMVVGWENYYHWNHDVIVKLHWLLERLPKDVRFIAPPTLKSFHWDTLQLLDLRADQLCYFRPDEVWELESLYFAVPCQKPSMDTHEPLAWFRESSQRLFGIPKRHPNKRIFLSRRGDTHFRTVNEPDVVEFLGAYGFEAHHPGHMSFREQVELFSAAEAIIGTGSGLFNMIFAPPGARILQLQEPSHMVGGLWTLSEALQHSYWYLRGETVPNTEHPTADADLFVPLPKLKHTLEAMLEPMDTSPN